MDSDGLVKGVGVGDTNIVASTTEGGFKAFCNVIVVQPAKGFNIDKSTASMKTGENLKLTGIFIPNNTTNKKIKWSSDNTNAAIVSQAGVVTAYGKGTAVITAKAEDGGYVSTCTIVVSEPVIGLRLDKRRIVLGKGEKSALSAAITPANANNKKINWNSSDTSVALVDQSGVVTAVKAGEADITASPDDGGYSESCKVVVTQPVSGINISSSSIKLKVGSGYSLKVNILPEDASDKKMKWTSDNESVAKVNDRGTVMALGAGTATITAVTNTGSSTAKCTVTVVPEVLTAPTITGSRSGSGIELSWGPVSGAGSYTVKRGEYIGDLTEIASGITGTSYADNTAQSDTTYYYVVSAQNNQGISRNSDLLIIKSAPKAPKLFGVKSSGNARLVWTSANGADRYNVYRSTNKGGPYALLAKNLLTNSYEDRKIGQVKYYYVIKAVNDKGESGFSNELEISDASVKPLDFISSNDDDGDGIANVDELITCTNPALSDTDRDGLSDGYELSLGTNPIGPDTDKDGLYDGAENILGTGPLVKNQNAAAITSKKEADSADKTVNVKANGDGNLVIAPLQIVESSNSLITGTAGVVNKVDIVAGSFLIANANVTFKYDRTKLNGVPEADLAVMYFNEETKKFEILKNMTVDSVKCTITGDETRLGTYVLGNKNLAPSYNSIDIIIFIDEASKIKNDPSYDPYRYRVMAAYSLVDWIYSNPSAKGRYNIGIVTYDDSGYYGVLQRMQNITDSKEVLLDKLNYLIEYDPNVSYTETWQSVVNAFFYNGNTNCKIMLALSSDGINSLPYVVNYISQNFNPRGFIVNTVAVGKNANRYGLQQIKSAGKGLYFEINPSGEDNDDAISSQIGAMCLGLSQQFSLESYVEGAFKPEVSANIEFSEEYRGTDNDYSNEWITGGANLLTGNYMEQHKDIEIKSNGSDIVFERSYNSNANKEDSIIGKGFRTNFDAKLEEKVNSAKVTASILNVRTGTGTKFDVIGKLSGGTDITILQSNVNNSGWHKISYKDYPEAYVSASFVDEKSTVEVKYPSGTKMSFNVNADGTYKAPFWSNDTLAKAGNEYIVTRDDLSKLVFDVSTRHLTRIEDRSGNALNISYSDNRVQEIADITGRKIKFDYNTKGKLESITDPLTNRSIQYKYTDDGSYLKKVIDGELKETTYEYDSNNRIEKVIDANGNTAARMEYDALGRMVRQYDALGNVRYQIYSDSTNERFIIDPNGNESRIRFNLDMKPVEEVDALGNKTRYEYSYYNPTSKKWENIPDVEAKTLEDNDDPQTKLYNTYLKEGSNKKLKTREKVYDKRGNPTTNEYDENHNLVMAVDQLNNTASMIYDPVYTLNITSKTDKNGRTTTFIYDNEGKYGPKGSQLIKEIDPLKNEVEYEYYTNEAGIKLKGLVKKVTERKRADQNNTASALITFKVTEYKYEDLYNNRTEIIDALGNHTYEVYDKAGRLESVTNARGYTTRYQYDLNDRIKVEEVFPKTDETKIIKRTSMSYDNVGNKTTLTNERFVADRQEYPKEYLTMETVYDSNNRAIYVYDPYGYRISYKYDAAGSLTDETDQRGNTKVYRYDQLNRVREIQDPLGNISKFEYDANGNNVKVIDAKQRVTYIDYDELDRKSKERVQYVENGITKEAISQYIYSKNDLLEKEIDPNGKINKYEYDYLDRMTKSIEGLGLKDKNGKVIEKVTDYSYNYENIIEDGKTVSYEVMTQIDHINSTVTRPVKVKNDALGRTRRKIETTKAYETKQEYDEVGNLKSVTDPKNHTVSYEYDGLNNAVKVTDATRINYSQALFDSLGNIVEKTDRRGNKTIYRYNKLNKPIENLTWFTDENNVKQSVISRMLYDAAGNKKTAIDSQDNTTIFCYDKLNRLVSETDPGYNSRYFGYDEVGNKVWETDRKDHSITEAGVYPILSEQGTVYRLKTSYGYDDFNRLTSVTNRLGEISEYTYDTLGNLKEIKVDGVIRAAYAYDKMYRLESKQDGKGRAETFTEYDLFGNLKEKKDRNGFLHTYTYNEFDKVEKETVTGTDSTGAFTNTREFYYDSVGNIERTLDETGETIYVYNKLNKLDYKLLPGNKTIDYDYDEEENLKQITDPSNNVTSYTYDEMNRMKTVTTVDGTTTYAYYKNGNRKSITLPNNAVTTYEYTPKNELAKLLNTVGQNIETYEYEYDGNGLQVSKIEPKGKSSFKYDYVGRIKTVKEPGGRETTYTYDGAGNRKNQIVDDLIGKVHSEIVYNYDFSNRLTDTLEVRNNENITTVYRYDGNGNQVKVTVTGPGDTITESNYLFDGFNQLKVAQTPDGTITSKYDAFGIRMQKTKGNITTTYYYDGQNVILEVRSDGTEYRNIYGVNLVARKSKNEIGELYYIYNGHADIVKLVDYSGRAVNEYDYDIFGNILYQLESKPNPYKYSGYYYDDETGYYYLKARYYDPKIARFVSEDTYTGEYNDPLSLNLYTYCENDPITFDDPNGHWLHIAIGALVGGLVNTAITAVTDFAEDGKFNKGWKEYAGSFVEGAVVGAVGAATGGASFIAAAAATTAASMAGNAAKQYITKGKVDVGEMLFEGAVNLVTAGAGKLAGNLTKKLVNKVGNTAFGQTLKAKSSSMSNKIMNKLKGFTTKNQAKIKVETKHTTIGMCFTEETLIFTKDGYKKIKDIRIGEKVYSQNTENGETGLKEVKDLFVNDSYELIHLYVGYSQIKTTAPHPFWVQGKGWVEAGNLLAGDKVTLYSGEVLEIKKIERVRLKDPVKVYNFEVKDWHTYFVSGYNILVHNAGNPCAMPVPSAGGGNALAVPDVVNIHFGVDAKTAKAAGLEKMKLFANHLGEQNLELNRMSLFETNALELNLLNYRNAPKSVMDKLVNKARKTANKYLKGKKGDGLDAAHALDSVAGGYINKFIGLRDGWANQTLGSIWKNNQQLIQPGKIHNLIPGVSTKDGFKTIEEFFGL